MLPPLTRREHDLKHKHLIKAYEELFSDPIEWQWFACPRWPSMVTFEKAKTDLESYFRTLEQAFKLHIVAKGLIIQGSATHAHLLVTGYWSAFSNRSLLNVHNEPFNTCLEAEALWPYYRRSKQVKDVTGEWFRLVQDPSIDVSVIQNIFNLDIIVKYMTCFRNLNLERPEDSEEFTFNGSGLQKLMMSCYSSTTRPGMSGSWHKS